MSICPVENCKRCNDMHASILITHSRLDEMEKSKMGFKQFSWFIGVLVIIIIAVSGASFGLVWSAVKDSNQAVMKSFDGFAKEMKEVRDQVIENKTELNSIKRSSSDSIP